MENIFLSIDVAEQRAMGLQGTEAFCFSFLTGKTTVSMTFHDFQGQKSC